MLAFSSKVLLHLFIFAVLGQYCCCTCPVKSVPLPGTLSFTPETLVAGLPATFNFGTFPRYNTSVKVTKSQLAVTKPPPSNFSWSIDLCLLDLALCGSVLTSAKPQLSPAPFLLPNYAPQGVYDLELDLTAVAGQQTLLYCSNFTVTVASKVGSPLPSPKPGAATPAPTPSPTPTPPTPLVTAVSIVVSNLTQTPVANLVPHPVPTNPRHSLTIPDHIPSNPCTLDRDPASYSAASPNYSWPHSHPQPSNPNSGPVS
ncbi:hypothetical protein WJX79_004286 [Trebouxia sp. C0005]